MNNNNTDVEVVESNKRYNIDNAGHYLPNEKVEQILIDLELNTSINPVAKKNDVSWETVKRIYEKYKDKIDIYRDEKRKEFQDKIWNNVAKAMLVSEKKLDTTLLKTEKIDQVIDKIMELEVEDEKQQKQLQKLVKQLTALTEYNIRDLSTYIGTLIDKHQLLSGEATERQEITGKDGGPIELARAREEFYSRIDSIATRNTTTESD